MNGRWQRFVRACSRREDGTSLALLRIGIGLCALYSLLSLAGASLVDELWVGATAGGLATREAEHWIWRLLQVTQPTPDQVWWVWGFAGLGYAAMTIGVLGRWPLLAAQQCYVALSGLNSDVSGGYDDLIATATLLMFCSNCTQTLSFDCKRLSGKWTSSRRVPAWPRLLLATQLLLMYTATGLQKVGLSWTPLGGYTALHYVLLDPTWMRFDVAALAGTGAAWTTLEWLLRVGTAVTWHWEQLAALMLLVLYFRATDDNSPGKSRLRRWFTCVDWRIPWALTGLLLHVGILLLLDVGPFSWVTLAYYVTLWSGGELRAGASRVRGYWQRGKRAESQ